MGQSFTVMRAFAPTRVMPGLNYWSLPEISQIGRKERQAGEEIVRDAGCAASLDVVA